MRWIKTVFSTILIVAAMSQVSTMAVEPSEVLQDAQMEERARAISKQLRCLVCQNENIDSSSATLAKDLRVLVRERLVAGDSDEEVLAFVVARYGDFVLLKPPVQQNTLILWLAPLILLFAGVIMIGATMRRQSADLAELQVAHSIEPENQKAETPAHDPNDLSSEEKARLDEILDED
jgi:cytochrome c-type biogenesis protein CcmH